MVAGLQFTHFIKKIRTQEQHIFVLWEINFLSQFSSASSLYLLNVFFRFLFFYGNSLCLSYSCLSMTMPPSTKQLHKEMVSLVWCGRTWLACTELWPQPHPTPFGLNWTPISSQTLGPGSQVPTSGGKILCLSVVPSLSGSIVLSSYLYLCHFSIFLLFHDLCRFPSYFTNPLSPLFSLVFIFLV